MCSMRKSSAPPKRARAFPRQPARRRICDRAPRSWAAPVPARPSWRKYRCGCARCNPAINVAAAKGVFDFLRLFEVVAVRASRAGTLAEHGEGRRSSTSSNVRPVSASSRMDRCARIGYASYVTNTRMWPARRCRADPTPRVRRLPSTAEGREGCPRRARRVVGQRHEHLRPRGSPDAP